MLFLISFFLKANARVFRVLARRVAGRLEQVERAHEPVDEALVLEPAEHLHLILGLERVRIPDKHLQFYKLYVIPTINYK